MVRPEPHQPLDEADLGVDGGVEARLAPPGRISAAGAAARARGLGLVLRSRPSFAGAASMPASAARCFSASRRLRSSRSLARRSALYSNTAREACALVIRSGLSICPAPGWSSSAKSAPRGSDAIAAIEPARGPKPKRCSARAALRLGVEGHAFHPSRTWATVGDPHDPRPPSNTTTAARRVIAA